MKILGSKSMYLKSPNINNSGLHNPVRKSREKDPIKIYYRETKRFQKTQTTVLNVKY